MLLLHTDVVGILLNEAAINRLVGAILLGRSDEWTTQRLPLHDTGNRRLRERQSHRQPARRGRRTRRPNPSTSTTPTPHIGTRSTPIYGTPNETFKCLLATFASVGENTMTVAFATDVKSADRINGKRLRTFGFWCNQFNEDHSNV